MQKSRYLQVAWVLTLVLVIYAIVAGNVDAIPYWTIAIPAVVVGFWWAFGRQFTGEQPPPKD